MLDLHVQEWLDLAVRWIHVIVGIAWIGTSFYFNWLNNRVREPEAPEEGVAGELWSVHGGGFYRVIKYEVAPDRLPPKLHWFKWEAYSTWISGVALLFIVYYLGPLGISVDPTGVDLQRGVLAAIGMASLAVGWVIYDRLCRTELVEHPGWFATVGFVLAVGAAFGYSQLLTGRAAYIHTGALLGTLMAANVFFVIIPSQREMVTAMQMGEQPDPEPGRDAARRSLHNNYLTLPVVFIMVSTHFPSTFADEWNWALLAGLGIVGALVRHWFNLRGRGSLNVWILPVAVAAMVALAIVTFPRLDDGGGLGSPATVPADVEGVILVRCTPCHSHNPSRPGIGTAPKGIAFDDADQIGRRREVIGRVVESEFMPLGNITAMTPEERRLVVEWSESPGSDG